MPVSRMTSGQQAVRVQRVMAAVEARLLGLIAKYVAAEEDTPDWLAAKHEQVTMLRRRAEAIIAAAVGDAKAEAAAALHDAAVRGRASAQGDLDDAGVDGLPRTHAERAAVALLDDLGDTLDRMGVVVLRSTLDAYRDAVAKAAPGALLGVTTRRQDAQQVLDRLAAKGLTGFTDKAGRRWSLTAYAEMATRTATVRAAVAGHIDRLADAGIDLVQVSDSPRECPTCRPWEGKVLSTSSDGASTRIGRDALTGNSVRIDVAGTVSEATRDGLFHPNCTHTLGAYIPGASVQPSGADENAEGYAAKQRQRAIERKIREWKRRQAVATTPEARSKAGRKVAEWQAAMRDLLDTDDGLRRQSAREQTTRAR